MVSLSLEAAVNIATYSLQCMYCRVNLKCRQKTLPLMTTTAKKLHGRVILLIFNLYEKSVFWIYIRIQIRIRIRIRMDPHHFGNLDLDPHPTSG